VSPLFDSLADRPGRSLGLKIFVLVVHPGGRLHDVAGEEPDDALPIALDPEQPVALAGAQQILQRPESVLPFVELRIDATHELLRLPHVHREARRVRCGLENAAHRTNPVSGARFTTWRRR